MQIATSDLPGHLRQRLHPDFLANEQRYHQMRDQLLAQYRGQWVAFAGGRVIAAADELFPVMEAAAASGDHPFIARVGEEDTTVFRVRRQEFTYDSTYQPFPLPRATVTFWNHSASHSQTHTDVIPDTGADLSMLPDADCAAINLFNSPCLIGLSRGVVGGSHTTLFYQGSAEINGRRVASLIEPVAGGTERLVGRDVLNQHRVVFDGPTRRVVFEP
jgi:hypothetical protein